jgi:hypothetical protein
VILRGLGLCFFDYMALLTSGRGGEFHRHDGKLTYEPSGDEPLIFAGSRRGVPYHARGANEKGVSERHVPVFLTPDKIVELQMKAARTDGLDFFADVWRLNADEGVVGI